MRAVVLLLAMLALAAASGPAAAQGGARPARAPQERYAVMWIILPDRPIASTAWIGPYSSITSARLVPRRAYVTGADAVAQDGRPLMAAGTRLTQLASPTMIACMMAPPPRGNTASVLLGQRARICLVDQDRDGRFEQFFRLGGSFTGFFTGAGRVPREREAMQPAAYTEIDPTAIPDLPRIYIRYGWFASLINRLIFQVCLGEEGPAICISEEARVNQGQLPATFELVEAKLENRVQVTMLTPIVARPLVLY
jgi:hypothetical protein